MARPTHWKMDVRFGTWTKLFGIVSVDFGVTVQLLITHFAFVIYLRKNIHKLFLDFKRA